MISKVVHGLSLFVAFTVARAEVLEKSATVAVPNSTGTFGSLRVDEGKQRLLICHAGNGTLDIINLKTSTLAQQVKTGAAEDVAVDSGNGRYYVTTSRERKLVVIDRDSLAVRVEIELRGPGNALCVAPKGINRVFVGDKSGTSLWVIDPASKQIATTLPVSKGPQYIVAEDDTSRVYQTISSDSSVLVISAADNNSTVGGAWPTAPAKNPHGLVLDTREPRRLFVAGMNGVLAVLKAGDGNLITSINMAPDVHQLGFDQARGRLYCPSSSGVMTVFDVNDNSIRSLGTVSTAKDARTAAVDPSTHAVWLAWTENGQCYAIKFMPGK